MASPLLHLPVDDILPELHQILERAPALILHAAPGTGKTTRVPPALLQAAYLDPKKEILVLEPRRLAAKMSARRVAQELGEGVGQTVGYQFRFENMTSPQTRLRFITEGMLMRKLMSDPHLKTVSAVILDEFHERHLHSDVALAFLRHLQNTSRPDLRLIVMSATLDTTHLASYLGQKGIDAPILKANTPQFEVEVEYLPQAPAKTLDFTVRDAVSTMIKKTPGDVLVFLPGMGEIRRAATALEPLAQANRLVICPLHGELSREEQDIALRPLPDRKLRKIILSTNVAETSLTIEGVSIVIDSGLHRQASHSWWSGVPALHTRAISRASAIQRTGRAGRLGPGFCLRLCTRGDFEARPFFDAPEIVRADLTQTILELKALGILDPVSFPWFESPKPQAIEASHSLLYRLGALDDSSLKATLTPIGKRMAEIPAHPRISRMLLEAEKLGVLDDAASLAAYLMEGRLDSTQEIDVLHILGRAKMEESIWRVRSHLLSAFAQKKGTSELKPSKLSREDRLRFAILCGYPDRVARRRPEQDPNAQAIELLFSAGDSARVENSSALSGHDYFVILDIRERQQLRQIRATTQVQSLCAIQEDWLLDLTPSLVQDQEVPIWDEARKRVLLCSRLTYDQLILSETRQPLRADSADQTQATHLLLKEGLGLDLKRISNMSPAEWVQSLSRVTDPAALESLLARLALILPDFSLEPEAISKIIWDALQGKSSLSELSEMDWRTQVLSGFPSFSPYQLDELAPAQVTLASGRKPQVHYRFNQAPWIESRLQDFFGMKQGPALLQGRLPLTLHLLAPNGRAVQVTTDLAGFWQRVYPELRPALSRRYPRHSWPEKI
ncbi:ATP-dependent helicase HrpB [Bdellovibrionota bacterium FG-1]